MNGHSQSPQQQQQQNYSSLSPRRDLPLGNDDDNDDGCERGLQQHQQHQQQQHEPPHVSFLSNTTTTQTVTTTTTVLMGERQSLLLKQSLPRTASNGSLSSSSASPPPPKSAVSLPPWYCCSLRRWALELSLYLNLIICLVKLVAYLKSLSLSVLAALVDSVLDVVSQLVLYYTERHSNIQRRSSALYPAGASRLEPIGVLTCAALMGMASFEVVKESVQRLIYFSPQEEADQLLNYDMASIWSMIAVVVVKLGLLILCRRASVTGNNHHHHHHQAYIDNLRAESSMSEAIVPPAIQQDTTITNDDDIFLPVSGDNNNNDDNNIQTKPERAVPSYSLVTDPTLDALAQDHWNDALSNSVAVLALILALQSSSLWFLDPVGAIIISLYIIHSWYHTGKEQIEQLTGRGAPDEFIGELLDIANSFDDRMVVDTCRAYHFGPKFLVELEVVLPKDTLLFESHDLGMELQYEIEGRPEVERCFVHIDYETRPYDEHVVSKVPELRVKYTQQRGLAEVRSTRSL